MSTEGSRVNPRGFQHWYKEFEHATELEITGRVLEWKRKALTHEIQTSREFHLKSEKYNKKYWKMSFGNKTKKAIIE